MANWLKKWYWREIGGNLREWVCEAPIVVKALFLITLFLVIWLPLIGYVIEPERAIRGTGVVLQLLGFIVAAYGLEKTLETFGQTPSTRRILPWAKDFPNAFDTAINAKLNIVDERESIDVSGAPVKPPEPDPIFLNERLNRIRKDIDELKTDVQEVRAHIDKQTEILEEQIEERLEEREKDVQRLRETFAELNVGDLTLGLEWVGVSLLIYGLLLSASPSLFQPAATVLAIPVVILTLVYLLNRRL